MDVRLSEQHDNQYGNRAFFGHSDRINAYFSDGHAGTLAFNALTTANFYVPQSGSDTARYLNPTANE